MPISASVKLSVASGCENGRVAVLYPHITFWLTQLSTAGDYDASDGGHWDVSCHKKWGPEVVRELYRFPRGRDTSAH